MSTGDNSDSATSKIPDPSDTSEPTLVRVTTGRIGKAHGLRGELAVKPFTDDPERRFAVGALVIAGEPAGRTLQVEHAHWHSGRLLVKFVGVDDRTAAEAIRGAELEADVDALETPDDPDEYFDRQLVGLTAYTPQGEVVGTVSEVMHLPGHDVLAVHSPEGTERLVPFVQKIVPIVDLSAGRIVIAPPPGLFDTNVKFRGQPPNSQER